MSVYPTQQRAVDPYDSYHSNIVNRLTRMVSRNVNCLHSGNAIDVIADGTSTTSVIVTEGECFKDDVLVTITQPHLVDFNDLSNYVTPVGGFNEAGYYYVILDYTYQKSRPAPQAAIKILKPSQRGNIITTSFLFLKCAEVDFSGSILEIVALHDYDPSFSYDPYSKRHYSQLYFGIESILPSFNAEDDENRVIYVLEDDEVYYGTSTHWEPISAVRSAINTTGVTAVGYLGYVTSSGIVEEAIATSPGRFADCVVVSKGVSGGAGMARLYGPADNVPVETGATVTVGEKIYLSSTESGKVTDVPGDYCTQCVGVCLGVGTNPGTVKIWFQPATTGEEGYDLNNVYDVYTDLLQNSIYKRLTLDTLRSVLYIDLINTTATFNVSDSRIDGDVGERFRSLNLVEAGFDSTGIIQSCQLSANYTGDIRWYVANDSGAIHFEGPITLDEVHDFSNVYLPITMIAGTFQFGEVITEALSGYSGVSCRAGNTLTYMLLANCALTTPFTPGRVITGQTSGATATITGAQTNRNTPGDYSELWIRANFDTAGYISDYGILYDEDEEKLDTIPENELNIETLYSDIYKSPSIDNDGMPQLTVPLQTRLMGYVHTQAVANVTWVINHNLNIVNSGDFLNPTHIAFVVCTNLAGTLLAPSSIVFNSANQLTITFSIARSGYARVIG